MTQAITSTSVSDMIVANISKEQEGMMREWVINKIPASMASYLDGVNIPWDKNEVLLVNIKRMGYNDIIFRYEYDMFLEETVYKPYFKFSTLAGKLGYNRPKDLFKTNGLLHGYDKYNVKNEAGIYRLVPGEGTCVIPSHLIDISDTNKYNYIYVNMNACEALIMGASRQSKFKDKASEFKTLIDSLNKLSLVLINKLNQAIAGYRYQQLEEDKKRLAIYDKQRAALNNALQIAMDRIKDIHLSKKYHMYIFTTAAQEIHMKYKFGITDDLPSRLISLQNGDQTDGGRYVHTTEVYNNRWSEKLLHQILRDVGLHCDGEWYMTPGEDASIQLLDTLATTVNDTYDVAIKFPGLIRDRLKAQLSIEYTPPIQAIMPSNTNTINEEPPITDFVKDVINKIGLNKDVYKTDLLKTIRTMINDIKYKKHKTKLPTNVEMFTTSADTSGIKAEVKESGRVTRIRFIIEVDVDTNDD